MQRKILEFKDFNGEQMFPNLELLIETVFFFFPIQMLKPNRFFSIVTDVKNKKEIDYQ